MIVRDIYAIPHGGRVVSKHRSRLHPDTLEALMCAQSWLWKEKEESSKMDTHFQSIELLDQPEGGANALNINRSGDIHYELVNILRLRKSYHWVDYWIALTIENCLAP
ncbi:hypothetical protein AAG906_022480 [Vitis piasezkii]